jgi:hypothetical protein
MEQKSQASANYRLLGLDNGIRGVSEMFGEWYQKTNKTEYTNKLTSLAFKIIAILHNTLWFWELSAKASLGIDRRTAATRTWIVATSAKCAHFMTLFRRGNRKKYTHPTPLIWRL